ncbi:FecR family protein [Porphyromonas pogonae]|uniref:FecR family protein n=1 Tax=Porphyromonas pogonae TaxID=867595 RepID=UPI002E762C7B|nr:FecR family protein [Porphyromonas pogonae]
MEKYQNEMADMEHLIVKQFDGTIDCDEYNVLKRWYEESAENQKVYHDIIILLKTQEISRNEEKFHHKTHIAWKAIRKRLPSVQKRMGYTKVFVQWSKYAAVIFVTVGITLFVSSKMQDVRRMQEEDNYRIDVPLGSKTHITLPDGTKVWINSGSTLIYDNLFGKKNRKVYLNGEAYFDVHKNPELPFNVHTEALSVRVLGTKFDMKAYTTDPKAYITLLEGEVNVRGSKTQSEGVNIKPNEQAIFSITDDIIKIRKIKGIDYTSWITLETERINNSQDSLLLPKVSSINIPSRSIQTNLFFDEEPLSQIIRDLERAFNVKIILKDNAIASQTFYGDFRNGESFHEILNIITKSNKLTYTTENNTIIIKKI